MSKHCEHCGKPLDPNDVRRHPTRKLCSRACRTAWQRAHPELFRTKQPTGLKKTRDCALCATPFTYYESSKRPNLYCSQQCGATVRGLRMRGENSPRFLGPNSTTKRGRHDWVKRMLGDACMLCGWAEAPCDVAHITARSNGGGCELTNVVILCPNHHRMFDFGKLPRETIDALRHAITPASTSS